MSSVRPERVRFRTDGFPVRDRFPAFYEGLFRHVVGVDLVERGSATFSGALDVRMIGAVCIADISITPTDFIRRAGHTRDGDDSFVVQWWRGGSGVLQQDGRESRVAAHEGLLIDNARPAVMSSDVPVGFCALTIPRSDLRARAPSACEGRRGKIADSTALRLLSEYLTGLATGDLTDGAAGRLVADHIVDLAAFALSGESGFPEGPPGVRAARRAQILRAIERFSPNPGLSAEAIARAIGITPRYVHLLLEDTGRSFSHHVLGRRLERTAMLLRHPAWRDRNIADIAAAAGFNDLSYFNRAFRRRFGATPTEMRAAAQPRSATPPAQ